MEEHHRRTAIVFLLLAGALLVLIYTRHAELSALEEQLSRERAYSRQLEGENQELLESVILLRQRVTEQQENLTTQVSMLDACMDSPFNRSAVSAPKSRVPIESVLVTSKQVILNIGNATPGIISPSKSMAPLLGEENIVLEVTPRRPSDILVGDIIIYEHDGDRIIHRVVGIGWDAQGWFAITKGDNNLANDPYNVRFDQVRGIVVGIIY